MVEVNYDRYFTDSDQFTARYDRFFIAAALANSDSSQILTEAPEYGELRIERYGWGNREMGFEDGSTPTENHLCTDEEFGIVEGA